MAVYGECRNHIGRTMNLFSFAMITKVPDRANYALYKGVVTCILLSTIKSFNE